MNLELDRGRIPFGGEAVGVIPARCASTRFPDKPLALIAGIPMICWTLKSAGQAASFKEVFVAAEDQVIVDAVHKWGGKAKLVCGSFRTGSDRVAEAVKGSDAPAVVNIQADEPFIDAAGIDEALGLLEDHPDFGITTIIRPISSVEDYHNPNSVKVVLDDRQRCLYFSRSPIPAIHGKSIGLKLPQDAPIYQHIGIYCYRRSALDYFARLPSSPLEKLESLEQLRFLESGGLIGAVKVKAAGPSVNAIEDLRLAERFIRENNINFDLMT